MLWSITFFEYILRKPFAYAKSRFSHDAALMLLYHSDVSECLEQSSFLKGSNALMPSAAHRQFDNVRGEASILYSKHILLHSIL